MDKHAMIWVVILEIGKVARNIDWNGRRRDKERQRSSEKSKGGECQTRRVSVGAVDVVAGEQWNGKGARCW